MEIGKVKQSDTIGKLKYDNVYVLDSMGCNFQDKLLKYVLDNEIMDDKHNTNLFIEKWIKIKNQTWRNGKHYLKTVGYKIFEKVGEVDVGVDITPKK